MTTQQDKSQSILITGGNGFLGQYVVKELSKRGYTHLFVPSSKEYDLTDRSVCDKLFLSYQPDVVIHLAAIVGGIGYSRSHPASFFYGNIMLGLNIVDCCRIYGVKKLVNIGSVCSYPKFAPVPFKEEDLWNGYPEETNAPYGIAKKTVMEYVAGCYRQYGMKSVNLLLTNLYGPGDDFRPETSHVIPATIRKIHMAKETSADTFTAWGDGSPSRDFLYVEDAAHAIVLAMEKHDDPKPLNIGAGEEITIKSLIEIIRDEIGFEGEVVWDTSKPNGQPRRMLDISKAREHLGFHPQFHFREGLQKTICYFLENKESLMQQNAKYS